MKTMIDVRNLFKRFGIFIYTGDRKGDLDLMELELRALHEQGLLLQEEYLQASMLLKKERSRLSS